MAFPDRVRWHEVSAPSGRRSTPNRSDTPALGTGQPVTRTPRASCTWMTFGERRQDDVGQRDRSHAGDRERRMPGDRERDRGVGLRLGVGMAQVVRRRLAWVGPVVGGAGLVGVEPGAVAEVPVVTRRDVHLARDRQRDREIGVAGRRRDDDRGRFTSTGSSGCTVGCWVGRCLTMSSIWVATPARTWASVTMVPGPVHRRCAARPVAGDRRCLAVPLDHQHTLLPDCGAGRRCADAHDVVCRPGIGRAIGSEAEHVRCLRT